MSQNRDAPAYEGYAATIRAQLPFRIMTLQDHGHRHAMRYFGLLAPGSKPRTSAALFSLSGQQKRSRPRRLSWAFLRRRDFEVPPIDSHGQSMHWVRRQGPVAGRNPAHDD